MKSILILGAYGLVGSNFIHAVKKYIKEPVEITKIKCDDLSTVKGTFDYIVFAAGYGQPLKFTADKIKTIEINTTSLIKTFPYLKEGGTFLYISSSEVYSGAEYLCTEDDIGTTNPSHPRACYIEGKRCGEAICQSFAQSGVKVKIARLALAYGPGTKRGDTRVMNQFIEQGFIGNIKLKDQGGAMRTYCYIDDVTHMLWNILLNGKKVVYNVGGFSSLTILELAEEIGKIMNASVTLPTTTTYLTDAPKMVHVNMDRVINEFNQSFTPISRGLRQTIEWQRKEFLS